MHKAFKVCTAVLLALVMTVSLVSGALAVAVRNDDDTISYEPLEQGVYSKGGYTIDKVSHPTLGAGEVDGILTGDLQDRGQSYSWSMAEAGDYVYIGTCYNSTYYIYHNNVKTSLDAMKKEGKLDQNVDTSRAAADFVKVMFGTDTFDETPINQQLEEIAKNSVTYVVADAKPLEAGDACSIAMKCFDDGEEIKALTCEDRTYLMGRGYMPEGFDEALLGMEPGQTKEFTFEAPLGTENGEVVNKPISCTVTVKEIQQEVVPVIDDAWVKANMPMFASKEALVADMRRVFEAQQREAYEGYVQQMAVGQLTRRFEGRIADEIYEATRDQLMQNLRMELQQAGMTWEQFVAQNGGEQQFGMMLMMQTREVLVQGFCLDAVYRHERLTLTDKDLEDACLGMNPQGNPKMMRQQLEDSGRGFALRETAERLKAARFVASQAKITVADAPAAPADAPVAPADEAKAADEN